MLASALLEPLAQVFWDRDFPNGLTHLDQLSRPGPRVTFDSPPLCPSVSRIVVIDVAQQQTGIGLMDDHPDIASGADRPKVGILAAVDAMKLHPGIDRIHLQIESGCLNRLLLIAGQTCEAVGECIGDSELHSVIASL